MADNTRPKRSKKRIESGLHGKHYERKILGLVTLKCLLDKDIKDFWILSNPQEVEKFDDMILFVEHLNGQKRLFMMQIKHKDEEKKRPVVAEKLDGNDNKLGLNMYQKAFTEIKKDTDFLKLHGVSSDTEMVFILFNNCEVNQTIENNNISFLACPNHSTFINTSTKSESILRIINKSGKYDQNFIDQFYFYTEQLNEESINNEIGRLLEINDETVAVVLDFFYKWVESKDCIKLWKIDVKVKLLDILISDFVPPLSAPDDISESILNSVINKFDITVIHKKSSSLSICNVIHREIKKFCSESSPTAWDECVSNQMEEMLSSCITNSETVSINSGRINKKLVYILMITQRKVPLFIKTNNRLFGSFKNKLLHALDIYSVVFNVSKETLSFDSATNAFQNFSDIGQEMYMRHSKKLRISFQGKADIDFYRLIENNSTVKQRISADNYIELLYKKCIVGESNRLPSYYINRQVKVPVLQQEVLKENEFMFFIFNSPSLFKKYKTIDFKFYESIQPYYEIFDIPYNIFTISSDFHTDYLKRIRKLSKDRMYCILKYIDDSFSLIYTNGSLEILRPYVTFIYKEDTELIDIYKNCNVNVICNNAGMGKSTFLTFIHSKFSSDEWLVYIDLKKYGSRMKKLKTTVELIDFSYACQTEDTNTFHDFLEPLYKNLKHKIVWLVDDYEEINEPDLLKLFKSASKEGFKIWIVSRPNLKLEFENIFGVFPMELTEFNKGDQIMFIQKYLKEKDKSEDDIKNILEAIDNVRHLLEDSFIGTCQQTMMLTEIFLKYENKWKEQEWHIHDIYENFIQLKVCDNWYTRMVSKLSLKVFFTDSALKRVFDLEEFTEDLQTFKDKYPKDFFVTEFGDDDVPIFSHRTYAEFLAARWLLHTVKKQLERNTPFNIHSIFKMLFFKELTAIRLFFDNMASKNLPLHSAIINGEQDKIITLINESDNLLRTDLLGRSIFHILSSYGHYFDIGVTPESKSLIRNLDVHSEIVQDGENILLKPIESVKSVENKKTITKLLAKIPFLAKAIGIFKEDTLFKLSSTEYALLSGSLLELDKLLYFIHLVTPSALQLTDEKKYYLLFHSIQNGYKNIFSALDIEGLDNVKIGQSKMSFLHLAIISKNLEAVEDLISEYRLDDWGVDDKGNTPLHIACNQRDDSLLKNFFIEPELDADFLNMKNLRGESHLHILARRGHLKWIKQIFKRFPEIDIDPVCSNGNTPFIMSILFNNVSVAALLKSQGANVKHNNNKSMSALHYAASKGFLKCVEKLLTWGAVINQKDGYGMTPLIKASSWGHESVTALLLKNQAKINLCDSNKWTALHHAVRRNNTAIVKLLLKYKASVNCVKHSRKTPLIIACKYNFPEAVKLLIKCNITFGKKNALRMSIKENHRECIDLLLQAGFTL